MKLKYRTGIDRERLLLYQYLECLRYRMMFSEFAGKYGREPRFKAVDKMKEREALYNEFLKEAKHKKTTEAKERNAKVSKVACLGSILICLVVYRFATH